MNSQFENGGSWQRKLLSHYELYLWSLQLQTMLSAGIPLLTALESLSRSEIPKVASTASSLATDLTRGCSLSQAASLNPGLHPFVVHLLAIGENSGKLVTVLERISERAARREKMERALKGAFTYPAVLAVVSLSMAFYMAFHMLPQLMPFLTGLEIELPLATRILVWGTDRTAPLLLIVTVLLVSVGRLLATSSVPRLQRVREWLLYESPGFGAVNSGRVYADVLRDLNLLIEAGCNLLPSLKALDTPWSAFQGKLQDCIRLIAEDGLSLGEAAHASAVFPRSFLLQITSGEEIGKLSHIFECLAEEQDRAVSLKVAQLLAVVEPGIFVFMGVVVGFVVLATFLPFYSLATVAL